MRGALEVDRVEGPVLVLQAPLAHPRHPGAIRCPARGGSSGHGQTRHGRVLTGLRPRLARDDTDGHTAKCHENVKLLTEPRPVVESAGGRPPSSSAAGLNNNSLVKQC